MAKVLTYITAGLLALTVIFGLACIWTVDPSLSTRFGNTAGLFGVLTFVSFFVTMVRWIVEDESHEYL